MGSKVYTYGTVLCVLQKRSTYSEKTVVFWQLAVDENGVKPGAIMVKGSSIARLKKRALQALQKNPKDRSYKEVKDISSWQAVTERWELMEGNQYAAGIVRSEKTREKMREAQRLRRKRELRERVRLIALY